MEHRLTHIIISCERLSNYFMQERVVLYPNTDARGLGSSILPKGEHP